MVFGEGNEHKVGQSEAEWSIGFHSLCSRRVGPSCSRGCGEASITVRYCAILLDSRTQGRNEIEELKRVGQVLSPISSCTVSSYSLTCLLRLHYITFNANTSACFFFDKDANNGTNTHSIFA